MIERKLVRIYYYVQVLLLLAVVCFPAVSYSDSLTEKDMLVITKILNFLENKPSGNIGMAIMRSDQNSLEAEAISNSKKKINKDLGFSINPIFTDFNNLDEVRHARVILLPDALPDSKTSEIFELAAKNKILVISKAKNCLYKKQCAIYFSSNPAVEIIISSSASSQTNTTFGSNFRMIVKEVP